MVFKSLLWALVLTLLASIGWRYRQSELIQAWLTRAEHKPRPIVFDNSPIPDISAAPPSSGPITAPVALHSMRKCQKGAETIYTDNPCQKGFRELPMRSGSVTVLESHDRASATGVSSRALPRATLRDVLDESGNDNLRDKRIERAINR